MFTYKDRTFCVNKDCKKVCRDRLTSKIEREAEACGMPIAYAHYECDKEKDNEKDT